MRKTKPGHRTQGCQCEFRTLPDEAASGLQSCESFDLAVAKSENVLITVQDNCYLLSPKAVDSLSNCISNNAV